jgi:hypothetical protein
MLITEFNATRLPRKIREQFGQVTTWSEVSKEHATAFLRFYRDIRLSSSDWTQLPDSPLSAEKKQEWATYRQQLRDLLSDTSANPKLIEIPEEPTA